MAKFRIIGIMTVRDEADILRESLSHAASMYDRVFVVDCGSEDESVDILKKLSDIHQNISFMGEVGPHVREQVSRHIWWHSRRHYSHRDWYVIADADEFIDPRYSEVIESAISSHSDHICGEFVNYYYTRAEAENWRRGDESLADRDRSIRDRRRYYSFNTVQVRAFRNLPWLRWNDDTSLPKWFSRPCERRIRFFHYQYRDLPQIKRRIAIRRSMRHLVNASDRHWEKASIDEAISPDDDPELRYDFGSGEYVPSKTLPPAPARQNHMKTVAKYGRAAIYGLLVPQRKSDFLRGK